MNPLTEVKVPDIGDYRDVPVIEVLVADGEAVVKDQPLIVLESDKATMEVPAPAAGIVRGLRVNVGDRVSAGSLICALEHDASQAAAPTPQAAPQQTVPPPTAGPAAPAVATAATQDEPQAMPQDAARIEVSIPDIGDYRDVPVIEVLVADGETVVKDQPLIVLESDKATMEVPAPAPGIVQGLSVRVGDKVSQGDRVCVLVGASSAAAQAHASTDTRAAAPATSTPSPAPAAVAASAAQPADQRVQAPAPPSAPPSVPYAGPATRKFARELGVDLAQVRGSGPRGRIRIEDVQAFVKQRLGTPASTPAATGGIPSLPPVDFAQFGEIEIRPLARIRRLSAAHLHRAWLNVPHVTQTADADITELEAFRKQQSEASVAAGGPKLTLLPFVMKACAAALKQYPEFNAALAPDGEQLILKKYCHIGFAADTPHGLVVPVVRDVWHKGIAELAAECAALAAKAREGRLKPDEMKGGCFSISSLGGIGGGYFTPIVNAPEVAILGVSKAEIKPVWDGKTFVPRLLCPLSLSYDHRVIDGAYAARFIVHLTALLADIRRLTL
ncbi:pyruvate dehydrogenase E2 component (dihydrolipoamide acetyltransferase) [Fontimonas thermophila]|uniref:Acetyltransferase component of pyruvate dehydrogenase complex n=1 Tax=Fontimonas thermophila TaxID=1076937 RepID=A0A1I2H6V2_9GAMM|nr:dihydrolipoyllysine-residue acetyltransferase [Fontimonas thermophila]SFF25422.1 pyruvate dehydrogenase E2 component (dihydrolipoamide acetyltransferase) [Fontimonas thermophila]